MKTVSLDLYAILLIIEQSCIFKCVIPGLPLFPTNQTSFYAIIRKTDRVS